LKTQTKSLFLKAMKSTQASNLWILN
jgi:hypothetical protein